MDKIQLIEYYLMKNSIVEVSLIDFHYLILMFDYYIQDKLMIKINVQLLVYEDLLMLLLMVMKKSIDVHPNDQFLMLCSLMKLI